MRLLIYGVLCLWLYHSLVFAAAPPPAYVLRGGIMVPVDDDDIPSEGQPNDTLHGPPNEIVVPSQNNLPDMNASESSDFRSRGPSDSLRAQMLRLARLVENRYKGLVASPLKIHNKLTNTRETPNKNELQNLAQKLNEDGPIEVSNDQSRIWMEPFYVTARTKKIGAVSGLADKNMGVLLGGQVASLANGWVVGVYMGSSTGGAQMDNDKRNKIKQAHKFVSLYHSTTLKSGWRYDLIAQYKPSTQSIDRLTAAGLVANGKRKSVAMHYNAETSYLIKLNNGFSIRPDLGLSLTQEKIKAFDETGGGALNNHYDATSSKSCEVYGGIGIRHQWKEAGKEENKQDKCVYKITAVYELGRELKYKGLPIHQTVISTGKKSQSEVPSTGNISHYLTFYGSMQINDIKFLASYILTLKQYRTKHNFGLKAEWRF